MSHVSSFLRSETLYRLALTLEYPEHVQKKLRDPGFPLTTLERFLESKLGRAFLGIELDDKDGFRGVVHPDRFKAVLARIAADVATEKGLTRRINDEEGFKDYIAETDKKIPKTKHRGSFTIGSLLGIEENKDTSTGEVSPTKKRREPPASKSIVPRGFVCASKHKRIRDVFKELRAMDIAKYPNSTGVMLRVLLDIALWIYIKDNGYMQAALDRCDPDGKKRRYDPQWIPPLRDLISFAVENQIFPGMSSDGYRATRLLVARDQVSIATIDAFNQFAHNPNVIPTEDELRALWTRAQPMLSNSKLIWQPGIVH